MKRNILNKLALLLLLPLLFSCRVRKHVTPAIVVAPDPVPVTVPVIVTPSASDQLFPLPAATFYKTDLVNKIIANQANFNTLSLRAKADLDIDKKSFNANMIIRIQKDKAIWVSVTAAIIGEVVRALITPDSIKIMNKLENTYIKKPFSYIYGFTNKQVSFNTLQSAFTGNYMPEFLTDQSTVTMPDKISSVSGTLGSMIYILTFNTNFRVTENNLKDGNAKQELIIDYGDFGIVSGQEIPQSVNIRSNVSDKKIGIDLKYNRIEIDVPLDIPFSVPARYKVKE